CSRAPQSSARLRAVAPRGTCPPKRCSRLPARARLPAAGEGVSWLLLAGDAESRQLRGLVGRFVRGRLRLRSVLGRLRQRLEIRDRFHGLLLESAIERDEEV